MARRGLTTSAVLPISLVLATRRDSYIEGLTDYRYDAPAGSAVTNTALQHWISTFVDASGDATDQSGLIISDIQEVQQEWRTRFAAHRDRQGFRQIPRADSATARILRALPSAPVLTSSTGRRLFGVSTNAALDALEKLRAAQILSTRSIARGARA